MATRIQTSKEVSSGDYVYPRTSSNAIIMADGVTPLDDVLVSKLDTAITITVGTGGDYATINEALAYATTRYPVHVSASIQPRITISLLAGFVMAEQVIVDGQDLSWITISSSAEISITRSALTTANADSDYPAFTAQNGAFLPIIDTLFNMDSSGTATGRVGVECIYNSRATITSGKGVKNAGGHGMYIYSSSMVEATEAIFTGAGDMGIYVNRNSNANVPSGDASGATTKGVYSSGGSSIYAFGSNAQMGASPATSDFGVTVGSFLTKGSTGGVSQTENTLTLSGIIFG